LNDNKSRYCFRCGKPLSVDIALNDEQAYNSEMNNTVKNLMEVFQNPELMKAFDEFKKNRPVKIEAYKNDTNHI